MKIELTEGSVSLNDAFGQLCVMFQKKSLLVLEDLFKKWYTIKVVT